MRMNMVRKQIFLQRRQEEALKRLAERTGKSEGALIREAVEMRLAQAQGADVEWENLLARWAAEFSASGPRAWRREDLYADRTARSGHDPH